MTLSRREFLSAGLVGLVPKSTPRLPAGGFVHESQGVGHALRDGTLVAPGRAARRVPVLIVGGGIAGLSAAWRLQRRGFTDFVLLELEPEAGGNARSGRNDVSAYPWAAHYVPVPDARATLVRELFTDLGVLGDDGWDDRHLCFAPQERLFIHGRWQEGFEPQVGPIGRDRDQFARFDELMARFRESGEFTIPSIRGLERAGPARALDGQSMAAWLDGQGLDSPWLRWLVDYACRDDYGALARDVSAWAGVHYFASRPEAEEGPLTWPEGNGWIVARLTERLGERLLPGQPVTRVAREGTRWQVHTASTTWTADAVIFAAPLWLAPWIVEGWMGATGIETSPWLVANLTLDRWPRERGLEPAWDNVIFDSPALGYVVATHQSLRTFVPRTVWTYYWALAHAPAAKARRWLLEQSWASLATRMLDDLSRAHPDVRDCVSRLDIFRLGHAMPRPTVGFLSLAARQRARAHRDGLYFAHSDVTGLALFEEAQERGVAAADAALARVGGR
ncbi:MAG: FAD-dependent oxidoreductase [Vicinamibacterales bacterium]|nr:FAD-dependent oxidoreductase [Vicinamibacterales bacterium]